MITRYYLSFWGCLIISHIVAISGSAWSVAWLLLAIIAAYIDHKERKKS